MRIVSFALMGALCAAPALVAQVPRPASDLEIEMPGEKPLDLKSFRGKTVVLAFISTVCPHCQHLTEGLAPMQAEYAGKKVQFVESAFNDGVTDDAVRQFVATYHPGFPVGHNSRVAVYSFLQISVLTVRPLYVPHVVLIDKTGVVRGDFPAESAFMQNPLVNLRTELDKLLAGPTGGGKAVSAASKTN